MLLTSLGSTALLFSCHAGTGEQDSKVNWGHMGNVRQTFIALPPYSHISTCGYRKEFAKEAVLRWAAVIGRDKYLTIDDSCTRGAHRATFHGPDEAQRTGECQGGVMGFTDTVSNVYICYDVKENMLQNIYLHEVGHMWGMCDQYTDGLWNCARLNNQNKRSMMGGADGKTELTPDDIAGMQALAARKDVPNYSAWQKVLAGEAAAPAPSDASGEANVPSEPNSGTRCGNGDNKYRIGAVFNEVATVIGISGLQITELVTGCPGEKAGLEVDDIIIAVDGTVVASINDWSNVVNGLTSGATKIDVIDSRTGRIMELPITLVKKDEE
jgi:hypothetical protein